MYFSIESDTPNEIRVSLTAKNYFGARHGIETLFQTMEYDNLDETFIMLGNLQIEDSPKFRHRGVMLDTARNFIEVDVLKRLIDGMGASKVF